MAAKVFIYNDNIYPLREMFKGEEVTIQANDYWRDKKGEKKEFDLFEANDFRGTYHPVPCDMSGKMLDDAKHYKKIKMIPTEVDTAKEDAPAFKCMAPDCKHISPSPEELEAHTSVRHANIDKLILPDEDSRLKQKAQIKR